MHESARTFISLGSNLLEELAILKEENLSKLFLVTLGGHLGLRGKSSPGSVLLVVITQVSLSKYSAKAVGLRVVTWSPSS